MNFFAFVGRWVAVLPLAVVVACLAWIISLIGNSFGEGIPSGIISFIAAGTAGAAATFSAKYVAPNFKTGAAFFVLVAVLILVAYLIAGAISSHDTTYPAWYLVLLSLTLLSGSVFGVFYESEEDEPAPDLRLSPVIRWLLCLPCAFVAFGIAVLGVTLLVWLLGRNMPPFIEAEFRFVSGLLFITVVTSLAPTGKRIIVTIFGAIWGVSGCFLLLGALFRPWLLPFAEHLLKQRVFFPTPIWIQAMQGIAWIAAAAIPIALTYRLPRKSTRAEV